MSVCMGTHRGQKRFIGAEVTGGFEPPHVGAGNKYGSSVRAAITPKS